jgi:UDP-glucose 4-epimerase
VNYKIVGRRGGDAEAVWAATDTAEKVLGWKSRLDVKDMCEDQWRWATKYPKGYEES